LNKQKLVLLIKVPPPLTGATYINSLVHNSSFLHNNFNIATIKISYSNNASDLGKHYFSKIFKYLSYLLKLFRILIRYKIAFFYFQISPIGISFIRDLFFVILIKMFRIRLVYHLHGTGIKHAAQKHFHTNFLYKIAFHNSTIICLSQKLTYDIELLVNKKSYIVPNAILPVIKANKSNNNSTPLNIIFISNLFKFKGVFDLLDSLTLLLNKRIDFSCNIIGDEGDVTKELLLKKIDELGLNNYARYLGPKFGDDKNEILSKADIMIYPTHNDAMPLVILEAFQFCIPVISNDIGAISDIIDDGVSGFLISNFNLDQISNKIELLDANRELLSKMGLAARKKYEEKYTLEIFEKNMKKVFDKVLQEVNGEKNV